MKILISPGFGAGWSSWTSDGHEAQAFMLTYKPLIDAITDGVDTGYVESGIESKARPGSPLDRFAHEYAERFEDAPYLGGARDLTVVEVEDVFRISEYDGSESVEIRDNVGWFDPDDFITLADISPDDLD